MFLSPQNCHNWFWSKRSLRELDKHCPGTHLVRTNDSVVAKQSGFAQKCCPGISTVGFTYNWWTISPILSSWVKWAGVKFEQEKGYGSAFSAYRSLYVLWTHTPLERSAAAFSRCLGRNGRTSVREQGARGPGPHLTALPGPRCRCHYPRCHCAFRYLPKTGRNELILHLHLGCRCFFFHVVANRTEKKSIS